MKSNLKETTGVLAVNQLWGKIESDFFHILAWLSNMKSDIDEALYEVYNDRGIFMQDEAVDILEKQLAPYDISRETIQKYYEVHFVEEGDSEEFINTLRIIAQAKVDALLPEDLNLEMGSRFTRIRNERKRQKEKQNREEEI